MKTINGFTDALDYVHHLGFAGAGTIAIRQANLCEITDLLVNTAGGYPYKVRFRRSEDAPGFPYLGEFDIITSQGERVTVNTRGIKHRTAPRIRKWVCYLLPSETDVADRVLARLKVPHVKGRLEYLNGVPQYGYTFKRKRDFQLLSGGINQWVHQEFMSQIHRNRAS
jgi:hypothetical protein